MPRSSGDRSPVAYVASGRWPDAVLASAAPVSAHAAQALARALAAVMREQGLSHRDLASRSGVAHTTIGRAVLGEVLVDVGTLARLEAALGTTLWPGHDGHRQNDDAGMG